MLAIAEQFFLDAGYEQTSVNAIIEKAGIAKGTFYHYFASKEDILDAVVSGYIEKIAASIGDICKQNGIDALEKVRKVIITVFSSIRGKENIFGFLHEDKNMMMHYKVVCKMNELIPPLILTILTEGVAKGQFKITYCAETVEYLMVVLGHLFDLASMNARCPDYEGKVFVAEHLVESLLGIKNGSLGLDSLIHGIDH